MKLILSLETTTKYKGLNLHKGQIEIFRSIKNEPAMFYTICTPRQWGKSTFAIQCMLYFAINHKNSNVMFTSLTYRQSTKVYRSLVKGIESSGIIKKKNAIENSITLINNSEIFFVSVQQPDNLLGYDIDYMFCDEAARYKTDTFERVLRPMLFVRGKKCILLSTPKGKNYFYNMFQNGKDEEQIRYKSFLGKQTDNPYGNSQELEDAKKKLPENLYRQEYLAEFIDGGGDVFSNIKDNAILNSFLPYNANITYYAGIDVARQEDYTVVTIIGNDNKVYEILRVNQKGWSIIAGEVSILLKKYNPRQTLVEINGVGDVFFDLLKKIYPKITPFQTNNNSKQQIIEELILEFQDKKIQIPSEKCFPFLYDELQDFSFTYSQKTRSIFYGARTGHDDCVMSLAIANHSRKHGATAGVYHIL